MTNPGKAFLSKLLRVANIAIHNVVEGQFVGTGSQLLLKLFCAVQKHSTHRILKVFDGAWQALRSKNSSLGRTSETEQTPSTHLRCFFLRGVVQVMKFDRHFSSYQVEDEDSMEYMDEERIPIAVKIRKGGREGKSKVTTNQQSLLAGVSFLFSQGCGNVYSHTDPLGLGDSCSAFFVDDQNIF